MLETRTFRIVFVDAGHGTGIDSTEQADKIVTYSGAQIVARP
jgi:hypothetical protein